MCEQMQCNRPQPASKPQRLRGNACFVKQCNRPQPASKPQLGACHAQAGVECNRPQPASKPQRPSGCRVDHRQCNRPPFVNLQNSPIRHGGSHSRSLIPHPTATAATDSEQRNRPTYLIATASWFVGCGLASFRTHSTVHQVSPSVVRSRCVQHRLGTRFAWLRVGPSLKGSVEQV